MKSNAQPPAKQHRGLIGYGFYAVKTKRSAGGSRYSRLGEVLVDAGNGSFLVRLTDHLTPWENTVMFSLDDFNEIDPHGFKVYHFFPSLAEARKNLFDRIAQEEKWAQDREDRALGKIAASIDGA